jgi:hypothetical protein
MALPVFTSGRKLRASELAALVAAMNAPTVRAVDATSRTTTSTSYTGTLTAAGLCGVSFVAPQSGKVLIHWAARLGNGSSPNRADCSPAIRAGSTVGSGTSFQAAGDGTSITSIASARIGASTVVTGLTPGDTYNVSLEQRSFSAGTTTVGDREVTVVPLLA